MRVRAFFILLAMFPLSGHAACDEALAYKIGQVDSRFKLSNTDLAQYLQDAANLWNSAAGKTLLFANSRSTDITINFVFDERQQKTIRKEALTQTVALHKEDLLLLKSRIDDLKYRYETKVSDFKRAQDSFQQRQSSYNSAVSFANSRGGADNYTRNDLSMRRSELESEARQLNMQISDIRMLEQQLRNYADEYNNKAKRANLVVNEINEGAGEKFQEGVFDSAKKTITIFQYQSINDLKRVLAHEFGHALKIGHVSDSQAIMYSLNMHGKFELTAADINALADRCKGRDVRF